MQVIQTGRRTGKTAAIVARLKDDPSAVVIVASADQAAYLEREWKVPKDQISLPRPEAMQGRRSGRLYVDNLDHVLAALFGQVPELATLDSDEGAR